MFSGILKDTKTGVNCMFWGSVAENKNWVLWGFDRAISAGVCGCEGIGNPVWDLKNDAQAGRFVSFFWESFCFAFLILRRLGFLGLLCNLKGPR